MMFKYVKYGSATRATGAPTIIQSSKHAREIKVILTEFDFLAFYLLPGSIDCCLRLRLVPILNKQQDVSVNGFRWSSEYGCLQYMQNEMRHLRQV